MKRKYEGVIVLKLQGQEEGIEELVTQVSSEIEAEGATMEQIDRLGKKEFAHENHAKQKHGYYVQYYFEADPASVEKMRTKLTVNENVMLQYYRRK